MREMDFSSSSQRVRVTSELVITIASSAPDSTTRRMSLVRRVRRLQQAARNGDFAPIDLHAPATSGLRLSAFRRQHNRRTSLAAGIRGRSATATCRHGSQAAGGSRTTVMRRASASR